MRVLTPFAGSSPRQWTPVPTSGTVKVMLIGTSITNGKYGNNVQDSRGGYRGPLFDIVRAANSRVDFVGSQIGPTGTGSGHEGYAGITVAGVAAFLAARLSTYTPHIVSVELGMNEVDTAGAATSCATSIIDPCLAAGCLVLVQNVIPTYAPSLHPTYNAQLALETANRRDIGAHVEYLDMFALCGLVPGSIDYTESAAGLQDWVHPSAVGYPKMAPVIFSQLSRYL
jgi:lysophospholipase L1-like esterase